MFFKKVDSTEIFSPIDGRYVQQKDIKDNTFNSGIMGKGFGIYPKGSCIFSPIDGEVIMTFPTGHAIGIKRKDGLEILIHIGIETVNLNGEGFNILTSEGTKVKKGDKLILFDKDFILRNELDPTIIIVFTNSDQYNIMIRDVSETKTEDVIADVQKRK